MILTGQATRTAKAAMAHKSLILGRVLPRIPHVLAAPTQPGAPTEEVTPADVLRVRVPQLVFNDRMLRVSQARPGSHVTEA